ncbi:MAG: hypothetical protein JWM68_3197 [Verrucomicrobiales bacterium]|nr:hypothetical protein [Verrucomicrobiales bacterium]
MKTLFILYDVNCAFCRRCRQWLEEQPSYLELQFIPALSEEARSRIPGIEHFEANNELTVVGDDGAVYQGPNAFIMCLYALLDYREWAFRLTRPALLPFARQLFEFVSKDRKSFSKWLERSGDEGVASLLRRHAPLPCGNDDTSCLLAAKQSAVQRRMDRVP